MREEEPRGSHIHVLNADGASPRVLPGRVWGRGGAARSPRQEFHIKVVMDGEKGKQFTSEQVIREQTGIGRLQGAGR